MCKKCLTVMLFFLLAFCSVSAYAGSPRETDEVTEYVLTESQYNKLRNNLIELGKINKKHQELLEKSQTELGISNRELIELKHQLKELDSLCLNLTLKTNEQENLLKSANESLVQAEKEFKLEKKKLERQRGIAYTIAAIAFVSAWNK